jgi:ATP-dependent 26S proteasome regulatory subunit
LPESQFNDGLNMNSGTVGAHVRHIIEHYQSLLSAAETVDYDKRARNVLIETQQKTAIEALKTLTLQLDTFTSDRSIHVLCSTNSCENPVASISSLRRELVFVHSHTTHHMAIIRILALTMKLPISINFGKATSTQKYEHNVQC